MNVIYYDDVPYTCSHAVMQRISLIVQHTCLADATLAKDFRVNQRNFVLIDFKGHLVVLSQWPYLSGHVSVVMSQLSCLSGHVSVVMSQWPCLSGHVSVVMAQWSWLSGHGSVVMSQ
ncbi:hypothetical protein BgiMline_022684 [Biomphalaria glabrata]